MSTNDRPFLTRPLVIDWLQYNDFPERLGELDYPQITLSLIEEYRTTIVTQAEKIRELEGVLEEIGADMYVGYKKPCGCSEAANKALNPPQAGEKED